MKELKLTSNRIRLILSASPELWYDSDKENLYVIDNNTVYKYADIPVSAWYIIKGGDLGFFDQITEVMPYRVVPNIPKTKQLDYFKLPAPSVVMWKVDSSNIKYVGYDSEQMKLYVMFQDDSVYEYSGVEPEIWNGIKNADSKGSYLHWFVKVNQYPYQRIGGFLLDYSDNYLSPNTGTPHPDGYLTGF